MTAFVSGSPTATAAPRFPVVYGDNPPDQFKGGRDISVHGTVRNGVFVGEKGTMVTKCPSKYQAAKNPA